MKIGKIQITASLKTNDPGYQILSDSKIVAEVNSEASDLCSNTEGVDESTETTVSQARHMMLLAQPSSAMD